LTDLERELLEPSPTPATTRWILPLAAVPPRDERGSPARFG
jgi:hypothetical protein